MNDSSLFNNQKVQVATIVALALLGLFLATKVITEVVGFGYIGTMPMTNTITVSGEGETYAAADIASIVFTATEDKNTVAEAQSVVTTRTDNALAFLKGAGVDDKDVKTTNYSIYPKYEWQQALCTQYSCPPGKNVLTGYTVSQTVTIKVRDTSKVGDILSGLAEAGITQISGPDFTVDDDSALRAEARAAAIADAKDQADKLASQLGVRLVRVVNFYENSGPYYPVYGMGGAESATIARDVAQPPSLPVGENKITSNVSVTYEIR